MKYILLLIFISFSLKIHAEETRYKNDKNSLIDWHNIEAQQWLDIEDWKEKKRFRESFPMWRNLQRTSGLIEEIGRVVHCVGKCILFRDLGENQVSYRSLLNERDDIETGEDSYLWIMLFDGSLVRLGPESSISLKEINTLSDEIFFNIRLNQGNILIVNRSKDEVPEVKVRDTDAVFFPLPILKTNPTVFSSNVTFNDYMFDDGMVYRSRSLYLNDLIRVNSKKVTKKSRFFVSSPLFSFEAVNPTFESYISIGQDSYLKFRTNDEFDYVKEESTKPKVNLRGYSNESFKELDYAKWYRFSFDSRTFSEVEANVHLLQNEFFTKRIASILLSREYMFKKYSGSHFEKISDIKFAVDYAIKLWSRQELNKRLSFLWQQTRRIETTNLTVMKRYRSKVLNRYGAKDKDVLRKSFYLKSQQSYYKEGAKEGKRAYFPVLNSEKQELWKKLNGIHTKIHPGIRESKKKGTTILDESTNKDSPVTR